MDTTPITKDINQEIERIPDPANRDDRQEAINQMLLQRINDLQASLAEQDTKLEKQRSKLEKQSETIKSLTNEVALKEAARTEQGQINRRLLRRIEHIREPTFCETIQNTFRRWFNPAGWKEEVDGRNRRLEQARDAIPGAQDTVLAHERARERELAEVSPLTQFDTVRPIYDPDAAKDVPPVEVIVEGEGDTIAEEIEKEVVNS